MFENAKTAFLFGGIFMFVVAYLWEGYLPLSHLDDMKIETMEELTADVLPEFEELAEVYPKEFKEYYGEPTSEAFAEALIIGKKVYTQEACWHCHSQFVRPVSNEATRYGPVSLAKEYSNEMNFPHLFGTRRVGPDLSRENGKHSNDWHVAHFYNPQMVVPVSVMPAYTWLYDETVDPPVPNKKGMAIITYVQWLGSWLNKDGDKLNKTTKVPLADDVKTDSENDLAELQKGDSK